MKNIRRAVLVLGAFVLLATQAAAQNKDTGEIRGTVTDDSGAVIPGVAVTATNTQTRLTQQVSSNETGTYVLLLLPAGNYNLSFEKPGFKTLVRSEIILYVGNTLRVDARLGVGTVSESVVVAGRAAQVNMETSNRSARMTSEALMELPILGTDRDATSLMKLAPGTARDTAGVNGQLNGMSGVATTWMFNGGLATYSQSWNIDLTRPNMEAIAEVNFETTNFSAEYGNAAAVFNITTKSGTNQFHGTLHEFVQNDVLGARNFFDKAKGKLRWHEFGGNVGGPIKKDNMFFFYNYKGLRLKRPSAVITTVPTAAIRAGDFSAPGVPRIFDPNTTDVVGGKPVRQPFAGNVIPASRLDAVAGKVMTYWPLPNQSGNVNNYYSPGGRTQSWEQHTVKYDHEMTASNRLSASFMLNLQDRQDNLMIIPGPACMNDCTKIEKVAPQASMSDTWIIRPSLLNEFRLSYTFEIVRRGSWPSLGQKLPEKLGLTTVPQDVFPDFNMTGAIPISITKGSAGFNLRQAIPVPADTVTWIKGRHIVKFGAQFIRSQVNNAQPWMDSGSFSFGGAFTNSSTASGSGLGFADFYLGLVSGYGLNVAPDLGVRNSNLETFIQDDFKIRPNLTVNIGVRHQAHTGWSEVNNRLSTFDPTLMNAASGTPGAMRFAGVNGPDSLTDAKVANMAPRIGFAWSPMKHFAVRASYGIFFFPFQAIDYSNQNPAGYSITQTRNSTDSVTPAFKLSGGPPMYRVPTREMLSPELMNGQSFQFWPHSIKDAYSQQFHFTLEREIKGLVLEAAYVGDFGTHLQYRRDINQVPRNLWGPGDIQPRRPFRQYQTVNGVFNDARSSYNSLQATARRDFTKGLMFMASYTFSKCIDNLQSPVSADTSIWRGPCVYNREQRFAGNWVYELPVGNGRTWLNRGGLPNAILGGWQISGIFDAETGPTLNAGLGVTNPGGGGPWIPNRLRDGNLPSDQRTRLRWFDTSAFAAPQPYTLGNTGKGVIFGPGFWNLDFSLAKNFRIPQLGEKSRLQFRSDFSNLFNHTNFKNPNLSIGNASAGTITSARDPRNIQLGLRLDF